MGGPGGIKGVGGGRQSGDLAAEGGRCGMQMNNKVKQVKEKGECGSISVLFVLQCVWVEGLPLEKAACIINDCIVY